MRRNAARANFTLHDGPEMGQNWNESEQTKPEPSILTRSNANKKMSIKNQLEWNAKLHSLKHEFSTKVCI